MTIVVKQLDKPPKVAPGKNVTELLKRVDPWHKGQTFNYDEASGAQNVFEFPGNAIITDFGLRVTTAFDASGTSAAATLTFTVPNDSGTETLIDAANTALQSTGWKSATARMIETPASGGFGIVTYTPGSTTAGQVEIYISYIPYHDEL